jgi:fumarate hydratase subunit alpha
MRIITARKVTAVVKDLCLQANRSLRPDVLRLILSAYAKETNRRAKKILEAIIDNARIAAKEKLAICQDTGMPQVFAQIGQGLSIKGDLNKAIQKGIDEGYKKGYFRSSVVGDPLKRGKPQYGPAIIHIEVDNSNKLRLSVLPKGFGCENKTQLKMFNPTVKIEEIKKFIVEAVRLAGPDACPPYIIGVGIGGTADYACFLAKKALLQKVITSSRHHVTSLITKLEEDLLRDINRLNIGPMGLGGMTTCLGIKILTYPTHIAGLPVAVNISCHALRSATAEL